MKFLGRIKNKITKNGNSENVPHLEITEVLLVHWNNRYCQQRLSTRFKSLVYICS